MNMTAKRFAMGFAAAMLFVCSISTANADTTVEPSPMGKMVSGLNPMNWKMPKLKMPSFKEMLPGQEEKARITKKKDGLFSEVGKTASNSWSRTKAALNPQKLNPVNFFTASARTPSEPEPEKKKPGFFHSLFNPGAAEAQDDATVTDFLSQSRPTP